MARGSTAREGRVARSEVPTRRHNGMPDNTKDRDDFYSDYQFIQGTSPSALKDAAEGKEASNLQQAKMRLIVAIGERMEALAKDPNWKGIDEMNDPTSPFNLKNIKEAITNQSREFCYQFDANGQLVSWAKGEKGRVRSYNLPGMLKGGVDVHNHPSEEGRPFGWTFSGADFVSYNRSGVAVGIVYSREGEYRLEFPESFSKRNPAEIERLATMFDYKFAAIQDGASMVLNKALMDRVNAPLKVLHTAVSKLAGQIMLAETERVAAQFGAKFTFKPNKGYEDWKPLSLDADENTKQSAFKASLASPPPEFKITSGRKPPHLTTFKEPSPVTTRGFKIGKPRDVKPKPKEEPQEPSNNNYYRL